MSHFNPNDPKHLVNMKGSKFITWVGLQARMLDQEKYIVGSDTEVIQFPTKDNGNLAVVKAKVRVVSKDNSTIREFSCIGDASPASVGKMIEPHLLRMAETRSLARALRIITRSEFTAIEEIGGGE